MTENIIKFQKPSPTARESSGKISDLIKQADACVEYLEENSVGYYYYSMLQELKKLTGEKQS